MNVRMRSLATAMISALALAATSATMAQMAPSPAAPAQGGGTTIAPGGVKPAPSAPGTTGSTVPAPSPKMTQQGLTAAPDAGGSQQPAMTQPATTPPANATTGTGIPSRSDTANNAFRTLDPTNRGYVTRADMDRVPGFVGFDNADANRDGQLSPEEFSKAWKTYSGQ